MPKGYMSKMGKPMKKKKKKKKSLTSLLNTRLKFNKLSTVSKHMKMM